MCWRYLSRTHGHGLIGASNQSNQLAQMVMIGSYIFMILSQMYALYWHSNEVREQVNCSNRFRVGFWIYHQLLFSSYHTEPGNWRLTVLQRCLAWFWWVGQKKDYPDDCSSTASISGNRYCCYHYPFTILSDDIPMLKLQIKVGNVYPMTLEMFQSLLNASYSYFTLLRRVYNWTKLTVGSSLSFMADFWFFLYLNL